MQRSASGEKANETFEVQLNRCVSNSFDALPKLRSQQVNVGEEGTGLHLVLPSRGG